VSATLLLLLKMCCSCYAAANANTSIAHAALLTYMSLLCAGIGVHWRTLVMIA
jgi:hypothetical protein